MNLTLRGVVIRRCDVRLQLSLMKDNGAPGLRTKPRETWWNSVSPRLFPTAAGNADSLEDLMFFWTNGNFLMHWKILVSERISLRKKKTNKANHILSSETAFKSRCWLHPPCPPGNFWHVFLCGCCCYFFRSCFRVSLFMVVGPSLAIQSPAATSDTCFVFDLCLSSSGDSEERLAKDSVWEHHITAIVKCS